MELSLVAKGLVKAYRRRRVVNGVDLSLERGEIVGLLGRNGAGKTTTFHMMVGLIRADEGEVLLDGANVTGLSIFRRARRGVGYLPQEPSVFRKMSVEDNLRAVLEVMGMDQASQDAKVEELLGEFQLGDLRKNRGDELSGGERRRLEIARALASEPSFLLLDEPFSGVDPIAVSDVQEIIARLRQKGLGILVTDHAVRETLSIVDRAYIMDSGKIWVSGKASEITADPEARRLYLGERFSL